MDKSAVVGTLALCCLVLLPGLFFKAFRALRLGRRLARMLRNG